MTNNEMLEWLGYKADCEAELVLFDALPEKTRRSVSNCRWPWNLRALQESCDSWRDFLDRAAALRPEEDKIISEEGGFVDTGWAQ